MMNVCKAPIGGLILIFSLAGCGGTNGTSSTGVLNTTAFAPNVRSLASTPIAGKYVGTVTNKPTKKSGTLVMQLAQATGSVGGGYTETFGTIKLNGILALSGTPTSLEGNAILPSSFRSCVYAVAADYNSKTHVLSGTVKETSGQCGNAASTFAATQQCYYTETAVDRQNGALTNCR
jgi:hypothetical protein